MMFLLCLTLGWRLCAYVLARLLPFILFYLRPNGHFKAGTSYRVIPFISRIFDTVLIHLAQKMPFQPLKMHF
jgi:hypothetical protein